MKINKKKRKRIEKKEIESKNQKAKKFSLKKINLKQLYQDSFSYIKDSKKYILKGMIIFVIFALIGLLIPAPQSLEEIINSFIKELLKELEGKSTLDIIGYIISNNIKSTFMAIFLGLILGVFPIISAVTNGYLLGFVSSQSIQSSGVLSLWQLLPHGIFEFPAIFLSIGLGIKLGVGIFKKENDSSLKEWLINSVKVFLLIVIPLLLIAGIIEGVLFSLGK